MSLIASLRIADKDDGLIRIQSDGSVLESVVLAYAATLKKIGSGSKNLDGIHEEKAKAELSKTKAQEEKIRFELDREKGKFLLKEDVHREVALKIGAIEAAVKHLARTRIVNWLYAVGGDAKKKVPGVSGSLFCRDR